MTGEEGFALPVGTVTFLLTDVEGSTQLWDARADVMGAAVARHYEILSEAIAGSGGVRPVEQGEGDSVVGAFTRPSDAVSAALEAQRALLGEEFSVPMHVRMAVHTGQAELRDEGNYFGQTVNRCARLRAIAHGGQILLSRATHDLVIDFLPDGVTLEDLGPHRLRDLSRAEHVYQLCHADLPSVFPSLRSLDALPNNLPLQLTSFVGRERAVRTIRGLFPENRMVTLTGSGGCGKTRLALHVAADLVDDHPNGAWWVELAPVTDPDLVPATAASALGVKEVPGQAVIDTLIGHLRSRRALLVLDNCEHLVGACATLADALVRACPDVTVLATSREPLGVEAETPWRVPSLELPDEAAPPRVETMTQYEAVRLFVERATKARPNFTVTNENAPAVAQICHRLDGIPLAIELAAARVRMLMPEQIADGLQHRFRLLTGGARTAMPRQQTLEASVEWSYNLLSDDERAALRRLSVFAGDFGLDAAERVCAGEGIEAYEVLDLLARLVDRSLVQVESDDAEARYRLLETIRQYARQKLASSDAETTGARDAHLAYFVELAERAEPDLEGHRLEQALTRIDAELDNVRAAFDWALLAGRADEALRITGALPLFWFVRGHFAEATSRIDAAMAKGGAPGLRAKALVGGALLAVYQLDSDRTEACAREALEIARELGDDRLAARALTWLGALSIWLDTDHARPQVEEAAQLAAREQDAWYMAQTLLNLGILEAQAGRLDEAVHAIERSLAISRGSGDLINVREALYWLGAAHATLGRLEPARVAAAEVDAIARRLDDRLFGGAARSLLASIAVDRGDYDEARATLTEALSDARDWANPLVISMVQLNFGALDYAEGRVAEAADRFAEALDVLRDLNFPWWLAMCAGLAGRTAVLRHELAEAEEYLDEAEDAARRCGHPRGMGIALLGRASLALARDEDPMPHAYEALAVLAGADDPVGASEALEFVADLAVRNGAHEYAARLLGAASALRDRAGAARYPVHEPAYEQAVEAARASLGDAFDEAWGSGATLSLAEATAYAMRQRGARGRPIAGWSSLTPTELNVVRLVSEGLTNPQIGERLFISRGTVKVHLSHIFAKLDVTTRSELAAAATRRNL